MKKKLILIPILILVLVLSFSLVTAVPVAAAEPSEVWVDDDAPSEWYDETHFATIQEGIDAVDPGGTVIVAAGTYIENVVIPPGKDGLQLIGAGSGVTSIEPASGRAIALNGNLGLMEGIRVEGFTLVADTYAFIALSGTVAYPSSTNLVLEDIVVDGTYGIGFNSVDGVTLTNVHLSNTTLGGGALELTGVANLVFTNGSIEDNAIGVRLQLLPDPTAGYIVNGAVDIHDSNLTGNVMAVENQDSGILIDATNNWWGSATGPTHTSNPDGTGDAVSDYVNFEPWSIPTPVRSPDAFDVFVRFGYDSTRYDPNNALISSIEAMGEYNGTRYMLEVPKDCVVTGKAGRINWLWLAGIDGAVLSFVGGDASFSEPCTLYITDGGRLYQDYWTGEWLGGGEWVEVGTFTSIVGGEAHLD